MLRRRRRQRLDRDVAAAAAAAAAAHNPRFEDDDEMGASPGPGYYASYGSDGYDPTHQMYTDYEDPAGGYDPYAAKLIDVPAPGGVDRPMSTATNAGVAGFGASAAAANYYAAADNNGQEYQMTDYSPDYSQPYDHSRSDGSHTYGDPQYDIAQQYAAAPAQSLSPVHEMSEGHGQYTSDQYSYGHAYGGEQYGEQYGGDHPYTYNDDPPPPAHQGQAVRPDSVVEQQQPRDLTVSNV
jgi:hypothetical protein